MNNTEKIINKLKELSKLEEEKEYKYSDKADTLASEWRLESPPRSIISFQRYRQYEHQGRKDAFNKVIQLLLGEE